MRKQGWLGGDVSTQEPSGNKPEQKRLISGGAAPACRALRRQTQQGGATLPKIQARTILRPHDLPRALERNIRTAANLSKIRRKPEIREKNPVRKIGASGILGRLRKASPPSKGANQPKGKQPALLTEYPKNGVQKPSAGFKTLEWGSKPSTAGSGTPKRTLPDAASS